ncbi:MAG: type II secretion system F family protein [Candidatus Omnitrophota bacterium]
MLILIFLFIVGAAAAGYYYFTKREKVTLPQELLGDKEVESARKEIDLTQFVRPLIPLTKNIEKAKFIPFRNIKRNLISAGEIMSIPQFFAFKLLLTLGIPIVGIVFLKNSANLVIILVLALIGYSIMDIWLKHQVKKRQFEIIKELPTLIDLLSLCVGAGLDFMIALARITKDFKPGPLRSELEEILHQGRVGKSKEEILRSFAYRVNIPEVYSFVRTLIQAEKMGTPVQNALQIQAEEVRINRFQRGEEQALKAPIKLLFPLMVFILPVVLIIVGGPILLQFLRQGIKF